MTNDRRPPVTPPGAPGDAWREALRGGAKLAQTAAPLSGFDVYVAGFHCSAERPHRHMEAHHWCKLVNADFLQCALFDANTRDANLIGVEYIVSERLFETLPEQEKAYWHPHNYEVFSGQLVAPGLPKAAEDRLMELLVNSYGKTWHTWHTGRHDAGPGDALPMGPAEPMWSFNRDGEADEALRADFQAALGVDEAANRDRRRRFVPEARPQRGVNRLADAFPNAGGRPEGVRDAQEE
jgi:hypothetical protein